MGVTVVHLPPGTRGRSVRNLFFLLAIILVNYTLGRPSPVDIAFLCALVTTVFCHQTLTLRGITYFTLVSIWTFGLYYSSLPYTDDPEVTYQLMKISYAISISICACLTSMHWNSRYLRLFLRVWILSSVIASILGTIGFVTGDENLTWDGRAKGFLDDPNMYGAFLLPGLMAAIYMVFRAERRWLYVLALGMLTLGIFLSFSRVAIGAYLLLGGGLAIFLNKERPLRMIAYLLVAVLVVAVIGGIALLVIDNAGAKFADRLTLAKDYDLGEYGRLNRYFLAADLILTHPEGLGTLQFIKSFPEPIHNFWLSSFMNYGWGAGFAWTAIVCFGVILSWRNYKRTQDPVLIVILLGWLGIYFCALLHEAERWRHLWLFTGLLWGINARNWDVPRPAFEPAPIERRSHMRQTRPALA
ncbi:MAG TPA: hypothetical protein VIL72_13970 [Beijerinckiaceae bacterium]